MLSSEVSTLEKELGTGRSQLSFIIWIFRWKLPGCLLNTVDEDDRWKSCFSFEGPRQLKVQKFASKEIHLALSVLIKFSKSHTDSFETNITSSAIWQCFYLSYLKKGQGETGTGGKKTGGQKNLWKEADWLCIGFKYSYFEVWRQSKKRCPFKRR